MITENITKFIDPRKKSFYKIVYKDDKYKLINERNSNQELIDFKICKTCGDLQFYERKCEGRFSCWDKTCIIIKGKDVWEWIDPKIAKNCWNCNRQYINNGFNYCSIKCSEEYEQKKIDSKERKKNEKKKAVEQKKKKKVVEQKKKIEKKAENNNQNEKKTIANKEDDKSKKLVCTQESMPKVEVQVQTFHKCLICNVELNGEFLEYSVDIEKPLSMLGWLNMIFCGHECKRKWTERNPDLCLAKIVYKDPNF